MSVQTFAAPERPAAIPMIFMVMLAISIVVHAAILGGVRFTMPDPFKSLNTVTLDVVLVNSRTQSAPEKPDTMAQASLDGGGNTDTPHQRAATPLPAKTLQAANDSSIAAKRERQAALESDAEKLMRELRDSGTTDKTQSPTKPAPIRTAPAGSFDREGLMDQARDIARLEGEVAERQHAYQTRPRRAFFGGRAKEARFARYVEDWRLKIERIGNLNYPEQARDQSIYGKLVLSVEIRADGSLQSVKVDRSSGHDVLDEAATNIVRLAAPYGRFPPELARDFDTLTIVRTWSFTRENSFSTR